jgi:hypothetical protein
VQKDWFKEVSNTLQTSASPVGEPKKKKSKKNNSKDDGDDDDDDDDPGGQTLEDMIAGFGDNAAGRAKMFQAFQKAQANTKRGRGKEVGG